MTIVALQNLKTSSMDPSHGNECIQSTGPMDRVGGQVQWTLQAFGKNNTVRNFEA